MNINNINYLNLTPHEVSVVPPQYTMMDKTGRISILPGFDPEHSITLRLPRESFTLSVVEHNPPLWVSGNGYYDSPFSSSFNAENLMNNTFFEAFDVIVVSAKCVDLLIARYSATSSYIQPADNLSQTVLPMDLVTLDKFYTLFDLVKKDKKVIGTLGFQKIIPALPLSFYADALNKGRHVSIPGLIRSLNAYTSMPLPNRRAAAQLDNNLQEKSLKAANSYLQSLGYPPFPTLENYSIM